MKPNPFFYFIFICFIVFNSIAFNSNAQKFFYSNASGNSSLTRTKIVGLVRNNIVVWQYVFTTDFDLRKSKLLVYNNKMELLHTTSLDFLSSKLFSIEFINETNRFSAVVQYKKNDLLFCELISFDADGNVLKDQTIGDSTDQKNGNYDIRSGKDGSIVLFRLLSFYSDNSATLQYHFIKNDEVKHSGNIKLPFDTLSYVVSKIFLDNNEILIPLINTNDSSSKLLIYKINLSTDSSINTIRNLNTGSLVSSSLSMSKNGDYYTIVSICKKQNFYGGHRIFYWKLNNDLTDAHTDTIFADSNCLKNIVYNKLNVFAFANNTSNIILSSLSNGDNSIENRQYFSQPSNDADILTNTLGGSFYEGRISSMTPQAELNGNGYYNQSNVYHGLTWSQKNYTNSGYTKPGKNFKQKNMLVLMNIADMNKIKWMQCFNEKIDDEILPIENELFYANSGNTLHLIYSTLIKKNKQALGDIIINSDGSHTIEPIISTNLRYEYFIGESFQLDKNSILVPCSYKGKNAFAKLTF